LATPSCRGRFATRPCGWILWRFGERKVKSSESQIIYGRHPVLAALRRPDTPLDEVIIAQEAAGPWLEEVRALCRAAGVRLRLRERPFLDRLVGGARHQGVCARRAGWVYQTESRLLALVPDLPRPRLLVAADGLTDPMNLGNLCRTALAAGAQGLILPRDRSVGLTPAVAKAAAGALEFLPLFRVTNLSQCLLGLKDLGFWVTGADVQASLSLFAADLTPCLVLVIGSEGKGLRPRVRRTCDLLVTIPLAAPEVGSLNAASAGAVCLFEIRRQRLALPPGGQDPGRTGKT